MHNSLGYLTGIDAIVMQDREAMIRMIQARREVQWLPSTKADVLALLETNTAQL